VRPRGTFVRVSPVDVRIPSSSPALVLGVRSRSRPRRRAPAGAAGGIVIHDAATTLRERCVVDESGVTWLGAPNGTRYELVTTTDDPAITNQGDGAFFPFDRAEVEAALAGVRYPLDGVVADVFILPFPRRDGSNRRPDRD